MEKRNRGGGGRYREPPKRYDEFEYVAKSQTTETTQQNSSKVNGYSSYEENPTEELFKGQNSSKPKKNPSKYKSKGQEDGYDEYTTKSKRDYGSNPSNAYDNKKNQVYSTKKDYYDSYSYGRSGKAGGGYKQTTKNGREQDNLFEDYYGYAKNDQMDEQRDDGKLMPYRKKDRSEGEQGGKKSEIGSSDNQKSDKPPAFIWKECMICLLKCGSNTPIWTCSECRVSCHLKCIKDWIYKQNNLPVLKNSERDTVFSWSCPHCQNKNKSALPQYFCFCGKLKNPKADVYLEPHSCGKTCGQKKGPLCSHPCSIHCHSGKCPPCEVEIPNLPCFCGKEKKDRKCGEQNRRSCEAVCNKRLACGVHVCQKVCHEGECMPCNVQVTDLKCYCGKTEKTSKCGDRFSCESVCSKPLNCGNHQCTKNCHPGTCGECVLIPKVKESCFCGRSQVEELLGRPRKDCTEPVPSCQKRCGRILPCGHPCNKLCHSGECECGLEVQKRCRCNGKAYKIPCHLQMEDVLCDRVCKKKKSCGVHTCDLLCCISVAHSLEHTCMEHCGKMLNCGLHPCPKKCHTGKCGDCSIMMNQRLRCACGDKQIPAPTKCGTLNPVCDIVCNKALPCGHNCYYKCHFGDCKPCQEIISKPCACKKKIIPGSICSMKMYCGLSCTNLLDCGHACGITCHDEDCRTLLQQRKEELLKQGIEISEGGCTQSCGVSREACGHPCEALCHPHKPCPLEPCKYMINITCACGNKTKFVECGSTDKKPSKELACDDKCLNLQRFKTLYEKSSKKLYYPGHLVKFGKLQFAFIQKVEQQLSNLLLGPEYKLTISIEKTNSGDRLRALMTLLPKHYYLDTTIFKGPKSILVMANKREDSIIPQIPLSEYLRKVARGDINLDESPFDAKITFLNLCYYDSSTDLERILGELKDDVYIDSDKSNKLKMYVWSKDSIPALKKKLTKSSSNFNLFEVEEFKDSDTEENAENSAMQMKEDSLPPLLANNTSEFGTVTENEEETHKAENFEELEFMVKANKKEEKNEKKPEAPREKSYIALMGEMEPGNLKITDPESSDEDEKITKKPKTSKNPQHRASMKV